MPNAREGSSAAAERKGRGQASQEAPLIRAVEVGRGDDLLDLGWEGRSVSPALPPRCGSVTFYTSDLRQARALEATAVCPVRVRTLCRADLPAGPFAAALYKPVRWAAKARVFELLHGCFHALSQGGSLYLAGRRDAGVESYRRYLEALFGGAETCHRSAGMRVYRAVRQSDAPGVAPPVAVRTIRVEDLPAGPYRFDTRAGVFSWDHVDPGTRLLLAHAGIRPADRVLDLGCGFGALGVVAARLARPEGVALTDVDALAVACARANVARNGVAGAAVLAGDGVEALEGRKFDLVLSNPPTHQGSEVARAFASGAAAHLTSSGRFCVVVRRAKLYARPMRRYFEETVYLAESEGYTVIQARKPRTA